MTVKHVVKQGEYLSLIAARHGFKTWKTIYNHPLNAEFKRKRPNPNVIHPGDEIVIPAFRLEPMSCETGRSHRFVVKKPPRNELIVVLKKNGKAIASTACLVEFTGANDESLLERSATTSATGELRAPIPDGATHARVAVEKQPRLAWRLAIGHMDPVRDRHQPFDESHCRITGIQARLNNLGFRCGKVDGRLGPRTQAAIAAFQHVMLGREDADGTLDEETCDRLEAEHQC